MTYAMLGGTLNPTHSLTRSVSSKLQQACPYVEQCLLGSMLQGCFLQNLFYLTCC